MRLFIACEIDDPIRARLSEVIDQAGAQIDGMKWVARENVHITLKFLGEVEEGQLEEIEAALDGPLSGTHAFRISFAALGTFPPKGAPQILWAGVTEGADGLVSLNGKVESALKKVGFEREKRHFSPHATLGRARKKGKPRGLEQLVAGEHATEFGSQKVSKVTLMKSVLKPAGPVYTPVRTWNLQDN